MKESDWKTFKKIKEYAIEKYCTTVLDEFRDVIDDEKEHPHDKYLLLYKLIKNRDKEMSLLFDYHSRSKAALQLIGIRAKGLANEDLLSKLSTEFLERTDPKTLGW